MMREPGTILTRSESLNSERDRAPSFSEVRRQGVSSLWDQARAYLVEHHERLESVREDSSLGKRYGEGVVRSKIDLCAENLTKCTDAYIDRRLVTGRGVSLEKTRMRLAELIRGRLRATQEKKVKKIVKLLKKLELRIELGLGDGHQGVQRAHVRQQLDFERGKLAALPPGAIPKDADEVLLLEEASQEYALVALDEKIAQGLIDPESINAEMMLELDLQDMPEQRVRTVDEAIRAAHDETRVFVEKGFISEREARIMVEYGERYAKRFVRAFQEHFGSVSRTAQELYEVLRDNVRKVAYQTKVDKQTLTGSDHGVRHIYEGNTHFAEEIMESLRDQGKGVDFKSRDEILIRQIIIDHDMGYTTRAARTMEGAGAAKDHPCIGCRYIEANRGYYERKFGKHGYEVARDVLLNHSYPSSKYTKERPKSTADRSLTYNRQLIRSVVSTVDSLGVTSETKAMDLFRHPEAIDILQNVKLYADTHGNVVDEKALRGFKDQLLRFTERLVSAGTISQERQRAYQRAIENKFDAKIVNKTLGQYAGIVRAVRVVKDEKSGELVPEVRMDVSRLQALVGESFGDPTSLAGFKKALEAFGMDAEGLKRLVAKVEQLRSESKPGKVTPNRDRARFVTGRAVFLLGARETTGLRDEREREHTAIIERFEAFRRESVRDRITELFDAIRDLKKPRSTDVVRRYVGTLQGLFDTKDNTERDRLMNVGRAILKHADEDDILDLLQEETRTFVSKSERKRLAAHEGRGSEQKFENPFG